MEKSELRKSIRNRLRQIDLTAHVPAALSAITGRSLLQNTDDILGYAPDATFEIPFVEPLFSQLQDKRWFFPTITDSSLLFYSIDNWKELQPATFGLHEPPRHHMPWKASDARAACILVPAIAATGYGERLGRGGGYYDRFLAPLVERTHIHTISVIPHEALLTQLPTEPHDVTIDTVLVTNSKGES